MTPTAPAPPGTARSRLERWLMRAWLERGIVARTLWPLSLAWAALLALRRAAYRGGVLRSRHPAVPVLVVGNRIVGGAGKTPTVLAIVAHCQHQGWHPGVVSRGHGRRAHGIVSVQTTTPAQACGDEPLLIHRRTDAPVVVGADRVAAARALLAADASVDLIVADDGLQHLALARDVEVIVFDARGAGNGWLLPAGPLREPLEAPSTAPRTLVLYNAAAPSTARPGHLARRTLAGAVALADWWQGAPASAHCLQALRGRTLLSCAAIARPESFFALLRQAGLDVAPLPLPDHYGYDTLPWPTTTADVVVTEKDAVKLDPRRIARERPGTRVWVAPLDFEPEPAFLAALDAALEPLRGTRPS